LRDTLGESPVRQYTGQPVNEPTTLQVYPGADGRFVLYDDDGATLNYLQGQSLWIRISWDERKHVLTLEPDARSKTQTGLPRNFRVVLTPESAPKNIEYLGRRIQVRF